MPGDYEEKYLALRDENTALKKKKNEQEATIKRMYTKLAMIEEALKKKRQADDKKPSDTQAQDNQADTGAGGSKGDAPILPVRRDVDAEKFIQVLRSENAALRKKNQSLAEKNRWLQEKLATRPGKSALASSVGPPKTGRAEVKKRRADGTQRLTERSGSTAFQGGSIESQVQDARKVHRDTFPGKLESALKSRLVVAEKQLVRLQKENAQLRAGVHDRQKTRDNNDSDEASDDNDSDSKEGKPRFVKLSAVEVEHTKRELRERQAQLAILNARYENLEANALAEREIQEKTLEQMEQMNRQVHKLRTQLQDVQIENEELETKAQKHAELDKEVALLREQNRRLEARMTALCESPFINDAFQRKERIDRLFDLEKLTEQQKATITRMTDENYKLQQLVKELQSNVKQMKQLKDGIEAELQRVKHLLMEERSYRSTASAQLQFTPRQPIVVESSKPPEPIVVNIPVHQPDRRDASSSPLHAEQTTKADPVPALYGASVVVARKYEDLMTPISTLLDPECEDVRSVQHLRKRVHMLQIAHLKAIQELERCEKMLQTQTDINRELSLEIEQLTTQNIAASSALQKRMRETELLCEERLQRNQRLEAEIRQLKYQRGKADALKAREVAQEAVGSSDEDEDSETASISESLVLAASELAPGEQLLELCVRRGSFERKMVGENSSTFVLCDFFDFESQPTPLMIGNRPEYNLSAIFKVTIDGFFLRYLASEKLTLELHQAIRGDFQVVGRATIGLAKLLQSKGVIKEPELPIYRVDTAVISDKKNLMGTLDVVLRLSMPIVEIWRLHLQSYPADISLLTTNSTKKDEILSKQSGNCCNESAMDVDEAKFNELRITVFACRGLATSRSSGTSKQPPSPYVHYQLLGFPDVFTNIVPESANPEFDVENCRQTFTLEVDACLLRFFSKFQLWFTVFDDQIEAERGSQDGGMIGKCGVFLHELVEGNRIKGWRQLSDNDNRAVGEISILIEWSNPFPILAVGSNNHGRGVNERTADLHVLDLDQQHSILQAFSSCLNGRVNYRQFLHYASPPEELELLTSKVKERLEAVLDDNCDQSKSSQAVADLLVPNQNKMGSHHPESLIEVQRLSSTMDTFGIALSESETGCLRKYFAAPKQELMLPNLGGKLKDDVALGYLLMHINPRRSCRDRLLQHKLRHTLRAFAKKKATATSADPEQVFRRFDESGDGYISRAEFRRALSVLGFELQNTEEEYRNIVETRVQPLPVLPSSEKTSEKKHRQLATTDLVEDGVLLLDASQHDRSGTTIGMASLLDGQLPASNESQVGPAAQSKPPFAKSKSFTSAADEFQRRKQVFTDRMKAIASASSKSLIYEQIEKKQLEQRRQLEATVTVQPRSVDTRAMDQRLDRFHRQQAAARTLQKQYRLYKNVASRATGDIIESDLLLRKVLKKWSTSELKTWTEEVVSLIENQVPEARKSKTISRKQFGFFLSKVPRLALPASLLRQLMEYFSIKKPGSTPAVVVAYRPLLKFIKTTLTDDAEREKLRQPSLWKVLHSIGVDTSHALDTFIAVGDMQGTGLTPFRKFRDALLRLGVQLSPKDLRLLILMFDVSGIAVLYRAFLYTVSQLPFAQKLTQTLSRCRRFGISALREKLIAFTDSAEDGTISRMELRNALAQFQSDLVNFTPEDAHILTRLVHKGAENHEVAGAERISIEDLSKILSRFANRNEPVASLEELNNCPAASLQGLATNCRKFLCGSFGELLGAFERFDWKESGIVSLAEFVSIARRSGFAVFTERQLKTMAKVFGVKLDGRFGVNYRQFLDWSTPRTLPEMEDIEAKLRSEAQARAQQLPSKQLTEVLSSWRQVFDRHAESSSQRFISRPQFRKICVEELRLPLSEEEMRALLLVYDQQLVDEVNYAAFLQLDWKEVRQQPQQALRAGGYPSVSFQLVQSDGHSNGKELVEEFKTELREREITWCEMAAALDSFSSKDTVSAIGEGEFVLAMRQLGVKLPPSSGHSIFQAISQGTSRHGKVTRDELIQALGIPSNFQGRHEGPSHRSIDIKRRKCLDTAVEAAARYSQPDFRKAFARFQEFCVVHHFGQIPAPKLWQEMKTNGFADLLSAKGVGLLADTFITESVTSSQSGAVTERNEQVALKGVHAFLKAALCASEAEEASIRETTTPAEAKGSSPRSRRVRSDAVHPIDVPKHDNESQTGDRATNGNYIRLLVNWCETEGVDFRGEFEQHDREYSGMVSAIEFKQVLLRLGLKRFASSNAEAFVGQLVREFRVTTPHDAVCYTAMLNRATMARIFPTNLISSLSLHEELRTRIRQRARFTAKIDLTDPNIYAKLDSCFSHFDREKKGFLSETCVLNGLHALKYDPSKEQLRQLMILLCVFRHNDIVGDSSAVAMTTSRMEFDAFVLDPYAFRVLHRLAERLFERESSQQEPNTPRIALLARSLSENDAPSFSGAVAKDVFYSLLRNALGRPVLQAERHSLQHLFDVNRNARIAYKLFLKVISQWRVPFSTDEVRTQPTATPRPSLPKIAPCTLNDVLASLYNQLSSIDFDAQIEILNEYFQDKDRGHSGLIKTRHLIRVFEQVGLSLSADGFKSLEVYFGSMEGDSRSTTEDKSISYGKILQKLMRVHRKGRAAEASRQ